eukprot:ANDGO_02019.mRNA.1 Phosphatidylinositol 4-phosphate 5-kinase 6
MANAASVFIGLFDSEDVVLYGKLLDWANQNEKTIPLSKEDVDAAVAALAAPSEPTEEGQEPTPGLSEEVQNRMKKIGKMGLYVGDRNDVFEKHGSGRTLYPNGDYFEGTYREGKRHGFSGKYIYAFEHKLAEGETEADADAEADAEAEAEGGETRAASKKPLSKKLAKVRGLPKDALAVNRKIFEISAYTNDDQIAIMLPEVTAARVAAIRELQTIYPSYLGCFLADKRSGHGKMLYQDGSVYSGPWDNDLPHGDQGMFTFANGDVYVGSFARGLKHGNGTYRFRDGASHVQGTWENGYLRTGDWVLCDGTVVSAAAFDPKTNQPIGKVTIKYSNGATAYGTYTTPLTFVPDVVC